ncbi:ThuA domain-containing protein [Peterkaempfera griseoplana]|uniref:ThuA domain-containing protein n=1 Tax=Peterkaempfera griseoplana TaxID=66896 RepID=UPI00099E21F8|nr:ThuA domain-containing protein [Peterkaempfera griseoplana]
MHTGADVSTGTPGPRPGGADGPDPSGGTLPAVLVFSRTTDYRHDSIPAGVAAFRELGDEHGFQVDATEDQGVFTEESLARYVALVFLSTSGDVLDDTGRAALEGHVRGGGGFVGVHSAACTEPGWPFFGDLVGARFTDHPEIQTAALTVEDHGHPATRHLPPLWTWTDEWYNFAANPRPDVRVLASVEEGRYQGGTMGADHPLVWCRPVGAGRSFYTALGHCEEAYRTPEFRLHLLGGLAWAARLANAGPDDSSA